jgi:hypothetical protein
MKKIIGKYVQPAFLLCIFVLLATSYFLGAVQSEKGIQLWFMDEPLKAHFVKEPIKPNKPLSELDETKLQPFEIFEKHLIREKDILDSLGTEEYIQWTFKRKEDDTSDLLDYITVFITYYEKPDAVPHVPEECYTGGGYQKTSSEAITFEIEDIRNPGETREIPGRIVTFTKKSSYESNSFPVLYFFNVNGSYTNTRTGARFILGKNLRGRHSYFSKVEFVFNSSKAPSEQDAVNMTEEMLALLLPALENDHWPAKEQLMGGK